MERAVSLVAALPRRISLASGSFSPTSGLEAAAVRQPRKDSALWLVAVPIRGSKRQDSWKPRFAIPGTQAPLALSLALP